MQEKALEKVTTARKNKTFFVQILKLGVLF
jgi:hypothetical protein